MTRILVLQNAPEREPIASPVTPLEAAGAMVHRCWAYAGETPESIRAYDGICISGGPNSAYDEAAFIRLEHALIREAEGLGIPMLGICLGSQLLASELCGRDMVFRRSNCEVGYKTLAPEPPMHTDRLAATIAGPLRMFIWHNDEVRARHSDVTVIAGTSDCPNQIWRFRDHLIWGIQGHPEITRTEALPWFDHKRKALEADGVNVDALKADAEETPTANDLISNFAVLCGKRSVIK
jgi:GMP synthase (glutamine-hydrolysing)